MPAFQDASRATFLTDSLHAICERSHYHVLELDVSDCWTRLLVSLRPDDAPSRFVQTVKANSSRQVLDRFPELEREMTGRALWSRGYYVRSVGDVANQTILEYLARQSQHHECERGDSRVLATYEHRNPQPFFQLRRFEHCVAEYNCHLVVCPLGHVPALELSLADELVQYVRRVAAVREFELISLTVLQDHVHLFAALRPQQTPQYLAFSVMNNTSHWMSERNPGAMKLWNAPSLWAPSAFVRTAGSATTNTVRSHLRDRAILRDE